MWSGRKHTGRDVKHWQICGELVLSPKSLTTQAVGTWKLLVALAVQPSCALFCHGTHFLDLPRETLRKYQSRTSWGCYKTSGKWELAVTAKAVWLKEGVLFLSLIFSNDFYSLNIPYMYTRIHPPHTTTNTTHQDHHQPISLPPSPLFYCGYFSQLSESNLCWPYTHKVEPSHGAWTIYHQPQTQSHLPSPSNQQLPVTPLLGVGLQESPSHPKTLDWSTQSCRYFDLTHSLLLLSNPPTGPPAHFSPKTSKMRLPRQDFPVREAKLKNNM